MSIWEQQYKKSGFKAQRRYPNENLIRFLAGNFKNKRAKILEIGCGSGANLWAIAKEGFKAYGLDSSPTALKLCRKMLKKWGVKADLKLADMRKLPYKNNYFDAVVDIFSIEHVDLASHKLAYREVYRVLRSGGLFFQWHLGSRSVSFKQSGGELIDKLTVDDIPNTKVPYYLNGLTCFLTPGEAKKMLQQAGFIDISIESYTRTYGNRRQLIEYLSITAKK